MDQSAFKRIVCEAIVTMTMKSKINKVWQAVAGNLSGGGSNSIELDSFQFQVGYYYYCRCANWRVAKAFVICLSWSWVFEQKWGESELRVKVFTMGFLSMYKENVCVSYRSTTFSRATFFNLVIFLLTVTCPYLIAYRTQGNLYKLI